TLDAAARNQREPSRHRYRTDRQSPHISSQCPASQSANQSRWSIARGLPRRERCRRTRERRSCRGTTPAAATATTETASPGRTATAADGDRTEAKQRATPRDRRAARERRAGRPIAVLVLVGAVVRVGLAEATGLGEEDGTGQEADVAAVDVEERRRIVALVAVLDRVQGEAYELGRERLGQVGGEAGMDGEATVGRDVADALTRGREDCLGSGRRRDRAIDGEERPRPRGTLRDEDGVDAGHHGLAAGRRRMNIEASLGHLQAH